MPPWSTNEGTFTNDTLSTRVPLSLAFARIVPAGASYTIDVPSPPGISRPRSSAIVVTAMTPWPHIVL